MNNCRCITVLTIVVFLCGCSAQNNYLVKLSPEDRMGISALQLSIEHRKDPKAHPLLIEHTISASGRTAWPVGASWNWSQEKHNNAVNHSRKLVRQTLTSSFSDGAIFRRIFSDVAATNHISLVTTDDKLSASRTKSTDARLHIVIYHKVGATVDYYKPFTYMGVVGRIYKPDGTLIYHRRVFSPKEGITNMFMRTEYTSLVEGWFKNAAQIFWSDVTK